MGSTGGPNTLCTNTCASPNDGECDDGGNGSVTSLCALGTDCADCGPRVDTAVGPFASVTVGDLRACAVRTNGTAVCWGARVDSAAGLVAGGLHEVGPAAQAIGVGEIPEWGNLRLFDMLSDDQGNLTPARYDGDVLVYAWTPPPVPMHKVTYSSFLACGIKDSDHHLLCWGTQAGQSDWVPPTGAYKDVAISDLLGCAIREDNAELDCWAKAGYIDPQFLNIPAGPFKQIADNKEYRMVCGIREDGTFACVNSGSRTEISVLGTQDDQYGRTLPPTMRLDQVSIGMFNACGIRSDNHGLFCWGSIIPCHSRLMSDVPAGTFKSVSLAAWHACGITTAGVLKCWGDESYGLGSGGCGTPRNVGIMNPPTQ